MVRLNTRTQSKLLSLSTSIGRFQIKLTRGCSFFSSLPKCSLANLRNSNRRKALSVFCHCTRLIEKFLFFFSRTTNVHSYSLLQIFLEHIFFPFLLYKFVFISNSIISTTTHFLFIFHNDALNSHQNTANRFFFI